MRCTYLETFEPKEDIIIDMHGVIGKNGEVRYIDEYAYRSYIDRIIYGSMKAKARKEKFNSFKSKIKSYISKITDNKFIKRHIMKFGCTAAIVFGIFLSFKISPNHMKIYDDSSTMSQDMDNNNFDDLAANTIESETDVNDLKKDSFTKKENKVKTDSRVDDCLGSELKSNNNNNKSSKIKIGKTINTNRVKVNKKHLGDSYKLKNIDLKYTSIGNVGPSVNSDSLSCDSYRISKIVVIRDKKIKKVLNVNSDNKNKNIENLKDKYKSVYGDNIKFRANVDGYKNGKKYFDCVGWTSLSKIQNSHKMKVLKR